MILSHLFDKLRKNVALQLVFAFMPILLIIVYIGLYMWDLSKPFYIFSVNDKLVQRGLNLGTIKEIDASSLVQDETGYKFLAKDMSGYSFDVDYGNMVYEVIIKGEDDYTYVLADGTCLDSSYCALYEAYIYGDAEGTAKIGTRDGIFSVNLGDWLARVWLTEEGDYEIIFNSADIPSILQDGISGLEVVSLRDKSCTLAVTMFYDLLLENMELNMCTILPTSGTYIDMESNSLIKNVVPDFSKNFIFGSNIIVVIGSMLGYNILLFILGRRYSIDTFHRKEIVIANLFAWLLLSLCIPLTVLML